MEVNLRSRPITQSTLSTILTIAGSDSSGGAGIEADLKTFSAHKCYGVTCITALTAQNSKGIRAVVETPKNHLLQTLKAVMEEYSEGRLQLKVVKTGMLTQAAVSVVAQYIEEFRALGIHMVVDPVMVSTSGFTLSDDPTMKLCMEKVIPNAFLCTPNMDEARKMAGYEGLGIKEVKTVEDMRYFAIKLYEKLGCENLLLKGGHVPFETYETGREAGEKDQESSEGELKEKQVMRQLVVDILVTPQKVTVFKSNFIQCQNSHGTGCTLSSAIAANLSKGLDLDTSVAFAIDYIHSSMSSDIGRLDHTVEPATENGQIVIAYNKTTFNKEVKKVKKEEAGSFGEDKKVKREKDGSFGEESVDNEDKRNTGEVEDKVNRELTSLKPRKWKDYINHQILDLIATDTLPKSQFLYFLKQDYYYLENYARIQGYAITVATTGEQIQAHTNALQNILQELGRHRTRFSGDVGPPGPACVQYCDYLTEIGQKENILGITVALAPCLHGYAEAGAYGLEKRKKYLQDSGVPGDQMYADWLADYTSDWYTEAHVQGQHALHRLVQEERPSEARMAHLREIFAKVTDLEIAFWDEVLQQ